MKNRPALRTAELFEEHGEGYTIARHILDEVATKGGQRAADLGRLVCDLPNGRLMGAWLRALHARDLVKPDPDPAIPGIAAGWHITAAGLEELAKMGAPERAPEPSD